MAYQVLSRKYRPRTFDEVIGQSHITDTLRKAVKSGRVAQAYIFSGTRGTGKTTMARIFAKALNCVHGPTESPCNECEICRGVDTGEDVDVIEIDGASHNSVEDVREIRTNASYTPARARYKVYYIDEVHMLSTPAFNALLKTLEEPPAHVKFIFATTEPHKIPLTIQSRCQRFDFRNIAPEGILARLSDICAREKIEAEEGALALVSRFAQGSMRDAESLLDQVVSSSDDRITRAGVAEVLGVVPAETFSGILGALAAGDAAGALGGVESALRGGTAARQFVSEFIEYLRDVLIAKTCGEDSRLLVCSAAEREALSRAAAGWERDAIIYAMQLLSETYARMARSPQTRGLLDVSIVKLAQVEDFLKLREFLDGLREGGATEAPARREQPRPFEAPRPAAAGGFDGSIVSAWPEILKAVRTRSAVGGMMLEKCAVRLDGDRLKVTLPASFAFNKQALEKDDIRRLVEGIAGGALGRPVVYEVSCDGAPAGPEPVQESTSERRYALRERALEDPGVKKIIEMFDGNIVEVEERDV